MLKIPKSDIDKRMLNNNKNNQEKNNIKENINILKQKEEEKEKLNIAINIDSNNEPYKKISLYKKLDLIPGSKNFLKSRNNDTVNRISSKINNFSTFQPKIRASNIKTSWNKKDKIFLYKKQKLNTNQSKENNNKNINKNKK